MPNAAWFWPAGWFWREIGMAMAVGKADLPQVDEDKLLDMILMGWLTLSVSAGSA